MRLDQSTDGREKTSGLEDWYRGRASAFEECADDLAATSEIKCD